MPPYRAIFNSDGWGVFVDAEGSTQKWLGNLFGPIENTQVDALFWCDGSGGNTARYDSEVLELAGERFGKVDPHIRELIETGNDPPKLVIREARNRGMDVFYSLRMNDVHDRYPKYRETEYPLFKEQNPSWMMGPGHPYGAETTLNFAVPEVRQIRLATIDEIFGKYDFDGVELDFMRSPPYFIPGEETKHAHLLTDLVRQVRECLDFHARERGRPAWLAARVNETIEGNRLGGFEVETWVREGLIDILIVGSGPIDMEMEKFHELVEGTAVKLYACLYGYPSHYNPSSADGLTAEMVRGLALNYWHQGADGIYLFNWFVHEEASNPYRHWPHLNSMLLEIGDPEQLHFKPIMFPAENAGFRLSHLPVRLSPGHSAKVPVYVGEDFSDAGKSNSVPRLQLRVTCTGLTNEDRLEMSLNGNKLPQGGRILEADIAKDSLEPGDIQQGRNWIELSLSGKSAIRVTRVEIHADWP